MIETRDDAYNLLQSLGAPKHLLTHVALVGEAADLLIDKFIELNLNIDFEFIRVGVTFHDAGKVVHTQEMTGPGSEHEPEGQRILLAEGVPENIARCCMSHARWSEMECSFEELIIALSDNLWKGKRVEKLELMVIDRIATKLNKDRWDIFQDIDAHFELIATGGDDRLNRSVSN